MLLFNLDAFNLYAFVLFYAFLICMPLLNLYAYVYFVRLCLICMLMFNLYAYV